MDIIYDVFQFIPHLLHGHYVELNETASSLCSTQCLSNMPIQAIDLVKIHRSNGCLPKLQSVKKGYQTLSVKGSLLCNREDDDIIFRKIITLLLFFQIVTRMPLLSDIISNHRAHHPHTIKWIETQKQTQWHKPPPKCMRGYTGAHRGTHMRMLIA